ncbi:hypothetical protein BTM29_06260 [Companilactobacillus allii]|uniref:Uncharacterized protein n=1 Tax=Companilactobacillus allii TaxID=1847728 RepID=A0A1P8Q2T3_9LACO|nr:hypothetical protein BTM29_06260 [Companilactobacillus allii]
MKLFNRLMAMLFIVVQLVLLWIPFELDYLYNTRLGFMRQILFMNETYNLYLISWIFWIIVIVSILVTLFLIINKSKEKYIRIIWLVILLLITIFLKINIGRNAPLYYYDLACFCLVILIQLVIVKKKFQKGEFNYVNFHKNR